MPYSDQPMVAPLVDGRLQLRHGPIDLVVEAFGSPDEVGASYQQATLAFSTILVELASELTELRMQSGGNAINVKGEIAADMVQTANRFSSDYFVTPMIAVAGAVADHVLSRMVCGRNLSRAYVNNGGDTALFLAEGQSFDVGVCANPLIGEIVSKTRIGSYSEVRGIATSGWRGRSHSLGIADAVTVLARSAAIADASATLIANAIDLPNHAMITRRAATDLNPDSDLGSRLVTVDVGRISIEDTQRALESGYGVAQSIITTGKIIGAYGCLNNSVFWLSHNQFKHHELDPVRAQERLSA